MGSPFFGVNIPAPKVKIKKELLEKYVDLYKGIRDKKDMVSWRTLIVTIRELLGEEFPDYKKVKMRYHEKGRKLIKELIRKTYLEELVPEIEYAVGIRRVTGYGGKDLDFLLLSGRHYPEPLIWNLADHIKGKGKKVVVVNPVGHYNDGQTRVVGPTRFFRRIKNLVILSSTQTKLGGSVSVLSNVIRLLRNPDFAKRVDLVSVVIPMFGGSRGHRLGQSPEVGFEVMEAGFYAKELSLTTLDLLDKVKKETKRVPSIKFYSVDIHNDEYPAHVFREAGFDFCSIDSSYVLSLGIFEIIKQKKLTKIHLKLIACDEGAVPRTQKLAKNILLAGGRKFENLQVVYIEKKRVTAGKIVSGEIEKIEIFAKKGEKVIIKPSKFSGKPNFQNAVLVFSDDMVDTGGSAEKDVSFVSKYFPNAILKIFAASHPVFSKGFGAMKRIGADYYILGNSLNWEGLDERSGVTLVDFSSSIYKAIQ